MTRPSAYEIRQQFVDYFVDKCGHTFVPSSPCVPLDDPTLMFTNAGMNQFKDVFLATGTRPYTRAANTQKCIRAGGKHNDLDDVGHDTYHHTFFEMLGNWSFGDYFKKEAIAWAWDLLTNVWGLDKSRLHATYFQGDSADGLAPDDEAADLWRSVTDINPSNIHPGDKKDNFWEMGDTGPCGPCSEIHIDLTSDGSGAALVNAGDARVIEIWNLVFIQFNRGPDGTLTPLPAKHVDTGMGFERITAVLQKAGSNYDTDIFTPIFEAIRDVTGASKYTGLLEDSPNPKSEIHNPQLMNDVAYRVVADHIRCLTFALTDGAMPSNEGRGYVLRRILRRAVRYGRQYLGTHEPFLHQLVRVVVETMSGAFPELKTAPERIAEIVRDEEASFGRTLERGITLFNEAADYAVKHHHGRIGGEAAFKLHDTFGFPIDLTELMAQERGLSVNIGEYERLMEAARKRARGVSKSVSEQMTLDIEGTLPATDDMPKYDVLTLDANLIGYVRNNRWHDADTLRAGDEVGLVLDRTCAYGEQGGQVGDSGMITTNSGALRFETTARLGDTVLHIGRVESGALNVSDMVRIEVDSNRKKIVKNHTTTHVLNHALREVLGDHVQQKGSLVDPDKTRFDLSHNAQISEDELARIEELVNRQIEQDREVYTKVVDQAAAREINTLRAVFGEKYPDRVRVVSIGVPVEKLLAEPKNPEWMNTSVEFCGGTHLRRTGEAGRFRLIEESAVAKGIRRVVGITGECARDAENAATGLARQLKEAAGVADAALPQRIAEITVAMNKAVLPVVEKLRLRADLDHLQQKARKLAKQAEKAGTADVMGRIDDLLGAAEKLGDTHLITANLGAASVDQLRAAADSLRTRAGSAAVFLAAECGGKVVLLAAMTKDLIGRGIRAGDLIKAVAPIVGGKGGGRPDMAQGGGSDVPKIDKAVREASAWMAGNV
ncbi:MAG: alanine--tRNA ligase [Phycisphaerae bacterium]